MHQHMYIKSLALYLLILVATAYQPPTSFIPLPIQGSVHTTGYYTTTISVGSKSYVLDVDTGSDLTWVPCVNADVPTPHYEPGNEPGKIDVTCSDPECIALGSNGNSKCKGKSNECQYDMRYEDGGSANGEMYRDLFHLVLSNGLMVVPRIAFGCGYSKDNGHSVHNSGVLGLGRGNAGILKQLSTQGVIPDVVGHCLSSTGGGFIFLGNYDNLPRSIVWKQLVRRSVRYSLGSATLLVGDKSVVSGLEIIFDSGSTYTYFNTHAYELMTGLIQKHLQGHRGRPVHLHKDDKTLPVCWKGPRPFGIISDVDRYFPILALSFAPNVEFFLRPKQYLIISGKGNACLGILDGGPAGLSVDMNLIGDISMQDILVVYDNENTRVGWAGVQSCSWT